MEVIVQTSLPNNNRRFLRRLILTIIAILVYILVFWKESSPLLRKPLKKDAVSMNAYFLFGELSNAINYEPGFTFEIVVTPPSLRANSRMVFEITPSVFTFDPNEIDHPDGLCINSIEFREQNEYTIPVRSYVNADFPICYRLSTNTGGGIPSNSNLSTLRLIPIGSQSKIVQVSEISGNHFWYPYDSVRNSFQIDLSYTLSGTDENTPLANFSQPSVNAVFSNTNGWLGTINNDPHAFFGTTLESLNYIEEPDIRSITRVTNIQLERPMFMRIVYPILLFIMFSFVILVTSIDRIDTFIEGGLTIFLGFFVIKELIIPNGSEILTVADFAIWGLILAFSVSLFDHIIYSLRWLPLNPALTRFRFLRYEKPVTHNVDSSTNNWISISEASKEVPISTEIIRRLCQEGKIDAKKIKNKWQINRNSIHEWISKDKSRQTK